MKHCVSSNSRQSKLRTESYAPCAVCSRPQPAGWISAEIVLAISLLGAMTVMAMPWLAVLSRHSRNVQYEYRAARLLGNFATLIKMRPELVTTASRSSRAVVMEIPPVWQARLPEPVLTSQALPAADGLQAVELVLRWKPVLNGSIQERKLVCWVPVLEAAPRVDSGTNVTPVPAATDAPAVRAEGS